MKFFLADYVPYRITADAIRTILDIHLAFMASAVTLKGTYRLLIKIVTVRWPWILSFREKKKQNSNRVKDVGVLSILAKVKKMQKRAFLALTALMG
jgi:hypothetical protein